MGFRGSPVRIRPSRLAKQLKDSRLEKRESSDGPSGRDVDAQHRQMVSPRPVQGERQRAEDYASVAPGLPASNTNVARVAISAPGSDTNGTTRYSAVQSSGVTVDMTYPRCPL